MNNTKLRQHPRRSVGANLFNQLAVTCCRIGPVVALCLVHRIACADGDPVSVSAQIITGGEGAAQLRLTLPGIQDANYDIEVNTNLASGGSWAVVDRTRAATNGLVEWTAPGELRQQEFFRVRLPQPQIFAVEPAIAPPDAPLTLHVVGQCFQSNDVFRVAGSVIPGANILSSALGRIDAPPQPPGWQRVELVRAGLVLSFFDVFFGDANTAPELVLQGPPEEEPPASPIAKEVRTIKTVRDTYTDIDGRDDLVFPGAPDKCGDGVLQDVLFSAEVQLQAVDLAITGRGLDFIWARTYNSRIGRTGAATNGWTFSYDVSLQPLGGDIVIHDGAGRADTFKLQTNGTYTCPEFFREGTLSNNVFRLTFADSGYWQFNPLDAAAAAGKLAQIVDRNGNTMSLNYDGDGRLLEVVDDLDRTNRVAYDPAGRLTSVTDFSGRVVRYEYDVHGDLTACVSPAVIGTPNGNDFPGGKTNRYTYSTGYLDDRENHLLLSVIDANGETTQQHVYQHNQSDFDFLRCIALQRWTNTPTMFSYLPQTPTPANQFATLRCIVNDAVGNVTEEFYDARHRCVRLQEFTGRATPGVPVTATVNRPAGQLRTDDPDMFESHWSWNNDSLCTAWQRPQTNRIEWLYQADLEPATPPRHRGNLRVARRIANGDYDGDSRPDIVVWSFEHDPRFGSSRLQFQPEGTKGVRRHAAHAGTDPFERQGDGVWAAEDVTGCDSDADHNDVVLRYATRIINPRGFETRSEYDAQGNLVRKTSYGGQTGIGHPTWNLAYNPHGQLTAITNAADGEGRRRVDTFSYHATGPQRGYLHQAVVDAGPVGRNLTTSYEYDARGNLTRCVDPRGTPTDFEVNALNQRVGKQTQGATFGERVRSEFHYDAADNLVRADVENRDGDGTLNPTNAWFTTLYDHDPLHRLTRLMEEEGIYYSHLTNEFAYDGNDQLVLRRSPQAVQGGDPFHVTQSVHDERGLLFREIRAPGSPQEFTTQLDYNGNGNCTRVSKIDSFTIKQTTHAYDGLDRRIRVTDAMGNETRYEYDLNGNLTRATRYGETNDVPGNAGNLRLAETRYEYDALDRLVRFRPAFFDVFTELPLGDGFQDNTIEYAPNGLVTRTTNDRGHGTIFVFDTTMFLTAVVDAKSNRVEYTYDANGNVLSATQTGHSDLGGPDEVFVRSFRYDALDRCVAGWDNVGNTNRYAYDSRSNRVRHTDPLGFSLEGDFDSISRPTSNRKGVGGTAQNSTRFTWDAASRCVALTDGNTNTTQYAYDSLDRLVRTTLADGTTQTNAYDGHGNLVWMRDANGTEVFSVYDALDRCVQKNIKAGPGVAGSTSFETYQYDGLSRLVRAANNQTEVTRVHDSLGRCVREGTASLALGFNPREINLRFDAHGLLLAQTNPSGRIVEYAYDSLDRAVALSTRAGAGQASNPLGDLTYIGPCDVARVTRPNGVHTDYTRSGVSGVANPPGDFGWQQVSRVNHTRAGDSFLVDERTFQRDRNQNTRVRARTPGTIVPGETITLTYDSLDRLVQSVTTRDGLPVQDTSYVFDPMGNRQVVIGGGMAQPYHLDPTLPQPADFQVNQYTVTPFDERQYDENGNLHQSVGGKPTDPVVRSFSYDYADRMVAVQGATGPMANYAYDALGRRFARVLSAGTPPVPVQTNRYLYAGGQVVEEHDGGGAVAKVHIYLPDDIRPGETISGCVVTFDGAGQTLYHHADDQGSLLALTDAAGNVVERFDYDDYGAPSFLTPEGQPEVGADGFPLQASAFGSPFLFHGLRWDDETGLYQTQARGGRKDMLQWLHDSMDPNTGSHLSRTHALPHILDQQGRAYASNNPHTLKKEEGGRHTPFHNRVGGGEPPAGAALLGGALPGGAVISAAVSSVSALSGSGGGAAAVAYAATGRLMSGGMPNRISMNVTVPKQTQGATFGERVNAGLHAAGGALAQGAARFRPAFFDIFTESSPAGLGAKDFVNDDAIFVNPTPVTEVLAHELAHVVQQRAGSPAKTKHDTVKNSINNVR